MRYISFEGIDGSGKSTALDEVARMYDIAHLPYVITKEPKGFFRDIILDPDNRYGLNEMARMFLYQADRAIHAEFLSKYKTEDITILCDRGVMSTLVYQAITTKQDLYDLMRMSELASNKTLPDEIILLHSSIEIARQRINKRDDKKNYFDLKGDDFFRDVQVRYEKASVYLTRSYGIPVYDINTDSKTIEETAFEIFNHLTTK